jgi:hypothetical protein
MLTAQAATLDALFHSKRSIDRVLARSIGPCSGSITGYAAGVMFQGSSAS